MSIIKDIANQTNVSASTVSLVLNNKPGISSATRQRVFEAMNELGYQDYAPRSAVKSKQRCIQFILYKKHGRIVSDTPFFSNVLEGAEAQVKKNGYNLMVSYIYEAQGVEEQLQNILSTGCVGMILLATEMMYKDLAVFTRSGVPFVVLDSYFEEITADTIVINNVQGAFSATRYLCEKGHSDVGYLESSTPINNFFERKEGYRKALSFCKKTYNSDFVFSVGASVETAYADMKVLLSTGRKLPTAFFADNDIIAIGAIRALREFGLAVPEDISIVGFDDIPMCGMLDVPLTTIRVPKQHIGMLATDRLIHILQNPTGISIKIEVRTELVERSSVAAPHL
ncbi:MAG: LacI family DNA-binding transcriptional regulator [Ruthenibacterium sp.]